ncbi:bifunctional diaminohydroxyphosphoribosylaminopyrimidine deaminase/5-amino-6-(5-phosphoribosylamino)uracil reductase RibD [Arthrobacter sp. zg-Y1110]|uniref:bifunctional diaminohydroxyphosphoribosylaminopyrimidine deaminase/5-amino-6-(5-phosphoribosylamino)uracil reductase RibD n=1 Tax=Arthrobacter sp. zg-Y1110 TaxID=2886932 RepID=UPI001D14A47D|nr:bifunctional diaminohydroxyphosphoribosylaminopyrimidine deaminase/5-amino-6-(5-phosphoribosylamino)uracil reductase RibD [Arthrobacter sp. zg-Y1110]MCC3290875.1 bifunctional diaminohydroxyphosphoribosylaminopyrimidine deaminase/5-amino-6-(5-phosphoribosylamino)uracil reductase RibD [Arthrobacter sp. zg-Y1110]UWX86290.1 bifunctional diaminohydroxyphosphoribosylaminopyrimidine deaminase/5-amino-6-(5-phosphoribosylamino)uracil reductase RibD [Arthrobacter sp. zg-Y1110]
MPGFGAAEAAAMETALGLAAQGVRGANPLVGAVILDADGGILATGYHRGAGTAHAEADALARAAASGVEVRGATMMVTLEPCNHTGRTGPCTQAILAAGLARVVFAAADPTQAGAGGAAALRSAGVEVASGLLAGPAEQLNARWFRAAAEHRPFVTAKIAQSLDGRIAAADGTSQWITGPEARQDGQSIRSRVDAILAGTGTVLADDPLLTARTPDGAEDTRQPLRVVVGRRPVSADAAVRGSDGRFLQLQEHNPAVVAAGLYTRGVRHVLIEGGATLTSAFLRAGLVDELVVYTAPLLLGAGTASVAGLGVQTLGHAPRWRWDTAAGGAVVQLGRDLRLRLEPEPDSFNNPHTKDS